MPLVSFLIDLSFKYLSNIKTCIITHTSCGTSMTVLPFICHSESLAKRICICSLYGLCFSTFFFFCLVCLIFNAVIFLPELLLCSHYFKLNHVWQRTVNTSVLKGFLSNWKPLLSTCYIAFYICLLHTTGLWGSSALMWNCPNTRGLSMENSTGKAEGSKGKRQ